MMYEEGKRFLMTHKILAEKKESNFYVQYYDATQILPDGR